MYGILGVVGAMLTVHSTHSVMLQYVEKELDYMVFLSELLDA